MDNLKFDSSSERQGDIAQLVVHLLCKQKVNSSSLFISTKFTWIAQLVRAVDLHSTGHRFEPYFKYQYIKMV